MADLECFFEKNGLGPLGVKTQTLTSNPRGLVSRKNDVGE
jgi:hypothetical protein